MFSDAGSFTARRRHRVLSLCVSFSFCFLFVSGFLYGLLEIVGLCACSAVGGCVRRLRCRIKALCYLILICNPFTPSTAMLGPDLVLTSCVRCSALRPDLTARRLLLSSLCWKMTPLPSGKNLLELLCYERDLSPINSSCFRSVYGDLCLWGSTIYPVAGSVNSTFGTLFLLLTLFHSLSYASRRNLCEVPELCQFASRKSFNSNNPGLCSLVLSITDSAVKRFSFDFTIVLCRQYGNIGSGRLWRTSAFTLQLNLVKLLPLFAGAVVKTYETPPWGQERPRPRSSFVEEKIGQLSVFSMRGSLCPDPIPVSLTIVLTVGVRTKVLKCLSKSQVKVAILKLEAFEVLCNKLILNGESFVTNFLLFGEITFTISLRFGVNFSTIVLWVENSFQRSVLKTLRAKIMVRLPLMAEELEIGIIPIDSEALLKKLPVVFYEVNRLTYPFDALIFSYVTSSFNLTAKSLPLVVSVLIQV